MKTKILAIITAAVILIPAYHLSWAEPAKTQSGKKQDVKKQKKTGSKADIHFESREFDFGSIEQGEKIKHVFAFTNAGADPLTIDKVRTSCGCTAAVTSAKTLLPGQKGTIETTFNSSRFHGHIHKTITVYSNDPDEPVVQLKLRGKVAAELVIVPPRELFFGLVEYKKSASKSFLLTQGGNKPLEVTKAECDLDFISTEIVAGSTGKKKMYQVMLHVSEKAPLGRFEGKVKIYTNLPKHVVVERKVMGVVKELQNQPSRGQGKTPLPPFVEPLPKAKSTAK